MRWWKNGWGGCLPLPQADDFQKWRVVGKTCWKLARCRRFLPKRLNRRCHNVFVNQIAADFAFLLCCWNLLSSRAIRGKAVLLVQHFSGMHAIYQMPTHPKGQRRRSRRNPSGNELAAPEATQSRLAALSTKTRRTGKQLTQSFCYGLFHREIVQ